MQDFTKWSLSVSLCRNGQLRRKQLMQTLIYSIQEKENDNLLKKFHLIYENIPIKNELVTPFKVVHDLILDIICQKRIQQR